MYPGQAGRQPPVFQSSSREQPLQAHGSYNHGAPPMKKQRGNTVITRYPPPPGYNGPLQPHGPYAQPLWQQIPPSVFQSQQHHRSQSMPQPYAQTQAPSYQAQLPVSPQYHPQTPYYQAHPSSWGQSAAVHGQHPLADTGRRYSAIQPDATDANCNSPMDGVGEVFPPASDDLEDDSLESEYDAECYFARHPDQINLDLCLGPITWLAPLPTRLALPSTFAEAELEALAPRKPPPADEESISEYFFRDKREEAFLSVRQMDIWKDIKDDLIFKELPLRCSEILSHPNLYSNYRARYDSAWDTGRPEYGSPTSSSSRSQTPADGQTGGTGPIAGVISSFGHDISSCMSARRGHKRSRSERSSSVASSRSGSGVTYPQRLTRPKPLPKIRDQAQEDVLAALGVTGSPTLVYETPGPAFGPPPQEMQNGYRSQSRGSSTDNSPPVMKWHPDDVRMTQATWRVATEDGETTPKPGARLKDSRKRAYELDRDEVAALDDDPTPKPQRFKQQRI